MSAGREAGDGQAVESVSALTRRIKVALEAAITPCWVGGEISNMRAQSSGHVYFSLKDAQSQIACVLFRGDAARGRCGELVRDGAQVILFAEIGLYEPRGSYQLVVRAVVDDGRGRLQERFEKLKRQLAAEGLFDAARKRPLPSMPDTVGFITSPTGAAVQDFIRILKRRGWRGRLVVLPVRVQGEGAAAEMVAALELAHALTERPGGPRFDLLVLGRGGGSLEDLWAFNEEPLVRAVAAARIPVIAAVGHEIDFTLCDFAADVRAETPSAAAELISSLFLACVERVRGARDGLDAAIEARRRDGAERLAGLRLRLGGVSPAARVERAYLRLDDMRHRLEASLGRGVDRRRHAVALLAGRLARQSPEGRAAALRERVAALAARLGREIGNVFAARRQSVARAAERLAAADPEAVVKRGYVIIRDAGGRPVVDGATLAPGEHVGAHFRDGDRPMIVDGPGAVGGGRQS